MVRTLTRPLPAAAAAAALTALLLTAPPATAEATFTSADAAGGGHDDAGSGHDHAGLWPSLTGPDDGTGHDSSHDAAAASDDGHDDRVRDTGHDGVDATVTPRTRGYVLAGFGAANTGALLTALIWKRRAARATVRRSPR